LKDYYLWFLIVFILIAGCVVCYKTGYGDGYKLGSSLCPAIQHYYPQLEENTKNQIPNSK
jgi:hypothetical protein